MNQISVRQWIKKFNDGQFDDPSTKIQCDAGWYDWFCRATSLKNKTKNIGAIVKQIKHGGKIDLDTMYVWFKNNCPIDGPLYDDFRFADIETRDVIYTIQLNCCWNDNRYVVYGAANDFNTPLFKTNSRRELVRWLNK